MQGKAVALLLGASALTYVTAQTFTRLGACPSLGCVFPPDQASFLAGQYFDIRLEVHAPVNGTEAYNAGVPDKGFSFCIQTGDDGDCEDVTTFFSVVDTEVDTYNFT